MKNLCHNKLIYLIDAHGNGQLEADVVGVRRQYRVVAHLGHHARGRPVAQGGAVVKYLHHRLSLRGDQVVDGVVGAHALEDKVTSIGSEAGAVEEAALIDATADAGDDLPLVGVVVVLQRVDVSVEGTRVRKLML